MRELALQQDDGPLAAAVPAGRLALPTLPLLVVAVVVAVGGTAWSPVGPPWAWACAGWVLALLAIAGRSRSRLAWPRPALLRALEYGLVLTLVGPSPWAYALLAALAFHHYDIVYRARIRGLGPPRWLSRATGGWEARAAVLVVAAALGVATPVAVVLAPLLAGILVAESVTTWTTSARRTGR